MSTWPQLSVYETGPVFHSLPKIVVEQWLTEYWENELIAMPLS